MTAKKGRKRNAILLMNMTPDGVREEDLSIDGDQLISPHSLKIPSPNTARNKELKISEIIDKFPPMQKQSKIDQ